MSTLRKSLSFLCLLAGGVFLLRGVKHLASSVSAALTNIPSSAYEYGYVTGQVTVSIIFITAAAGFLLLGWRRLHAQRNQ